jgi:hypothetical protein
MEKRTKNQIIEDLKAEIVRLVNESEDLKNRNKDWKAFYSELFFILYGAEERFYFDTKDKTIEKIKEIIKEKELMERMINDLEKLNDKYWQLIRGIAGDKTLEMEINQKENKENYVVLPPEKYVI